MEITDVQVTLCEDQRDRLRAYCAVIFDDAFVVHNIRIIEKSGTLLVAMPSRKVTSKCPACHYKNPVDALYCGHCGARLETSERSKAEAGSSRIHFDVAHPINPACRRMIERHVLEAYRSTISRAESST